MSGAELVDAPPPASGNFAHLEAEAATLESGAAPGAAAAADQAEAALLAQTAEELRQALDMARLLVRPMFGWWPAFDSTWSDRTLTGIAGGGAAVMVKHGWTMGQLFADWGPYVVLIAATAPPTIVTYGAIQQRKAEFAAAQRQAQQQQRPHDDTQGTPNVGAGQAPN